MNITFTTYQGLHNVVVNRLLPQIPLDVTKVVGIPRSGLVPATMIAFDRHIHLGAVGLGNIPGGDRIAQYAKPDNGKVLVIDDAVTRGIKTREAKEQLEANGREVITAAVFIQKGDEHKVDIFGEYQSHPRLFEWNLFNHGLGPRMIFDLDGVMCLDPPMFDYDATEYRNYLANAVPLYLPRWPIGTICTNRIERWRGITEDWLRRHGVKYSKLLMNPAKTATERRKDPLKHKVSCYNASSAVLFVESSTAQAQQIALKTGRPVLSLEDKRLY